MACPYFRNVGEAVSRDPRWRVDTGAIALGFFSFAKLLMYEDLDPDRWPEEIRPADHSVLRALLYDGFREGASVDDQGRLDDVVEPRDLYQIADADGSQTSAMLEIGNGRNLVIQGPPGTGKSQTITNVIADAIASGKKVLFVAEKMAALEVVKRRLDRVHLGDACLELHSHKTNKKSFLDELQRTLRLGRPRAQGRKQEIQELREARDRINEYCDAVNTPIADSGVTPYQAYGALLQLTEKRDEVEWPQIDNSQIRRWSQGELRRRRSMVEELQAHLVRAGIPVEHPFWGSRRALFLPQDKEVVERTSRAAAEALGSFLDSAKALTQEMGLESPRRIIDAEMLLHAARTALEAPDLRSLPLEEETWLRQRDEIGEALAAGQRVQELRDEHGGTLLPEAWEDDVLEIRKDLAGYGQKWWRFLSGRYRTARLAMAGLCAAGSSPKAGELLELADAILEERRLRALVEERRQLLESLFGDRWQGASSEWSGLRSAADFLAGARSEVEEGKLPWAILSYLAAAWDRERLGELAAGVGDALDGYRGELARASEAVELDEAIRFDGGSWWDEPFSGQRSTLDRWLEESHRLQEMVYWNQQTQKMQEEELLPVVEVARSWPAAGSHLCDLLELAWYGGLVEEVMRERPVLASFQGATHEQVIDRFRELDRRWLRLNRAYVALQHWESMPREAGVGQMAELRRELEKKRRHLPIRRLMERSGHAIQAIKPVFMMSPLSVAAYVPIASVSFDLVVFDEASQVRPVDAFGAILRGGQCVVVGDSRQLPPTAFFDKVGDSDEEEFQTETGDLESVLGLFCAQEATERMLRWHYRSRHESLIAVSNREFYDDQLFVFPSPDQSRDSIGLVFHHLPDTAYERGKAVNPQEARKVAEAVMEHARATPHMTLGVAAFSRAQMQTIQDQLELLRLRDSSCESFFAAHPEEPFFVKNLENVQGDERDAIFISVGYGRTREGVLSMNFGPLNKQGGDRRLNVLITRARQRCEIFSNLRADDLDLSRTNARGVVAFKTFLRYAETAVLEAGESDTGEVDSSFEEAVAQVLGDNGYEVHRQVGMAGFSLDLAIVDRANPGRYLLGIECDGPTYHRARWARDRDRLRREVLESLGWKVHRIWSTDWFRSPEQELRRVLAALEAIPEDRRVEPGLAGEASPRNMDKSGTEAFERVEAEPRADHSSTVAEEYRMANLTASLEGVQLHEVPTSRLSEWIEEVVEVESPVHVSEVASRIVKAVGVKRVGRRIREAIEAAIRVAESRGRVVSREDFLWRADMTEPPVRDRSKIPGASRKIDYVAPEEIDRAVVEVVRSGVGIEREQAAAEACRTLGFGRITDNLRQPVEERIDPLLERGWLVVNGGFLTLPRSTD